MKALNVTESTEGRLRKTRDEIKKNSIPVLGNTLPVNLAAMAEVNMGPIGL